MAANIANPSSVGEATAFQVLTAQGRALITEECNSAIAGIFAKKHRVPNIASVIPEERILKELHEFGSSDDAKVTA
jgi:hypothetical protein